MGKTRRKERIDELNHRPPAIIVEETYWIDVDYDCVSKIRNPRRLNERFGPKRKA